MLWVNVSTCSTVTVTVRSLKYLGHVGARLQRCLGEGNQAGYTMG